MGTQHEPPSIAIIAALPKELAALKLVFGEGSERQVPGKGAGRRFQPVRVPSEHGGEHSAALLLLPDMGNNTAAIVATIILANLPTVEHVIMCGIAGGVPRPGELENDVRLGDIVVSNRNGVVQYDLVKKTRKFIEYRFPPRPPGAELLEAMRHLDADEQLGRRPWLDIIARHQTAEAKWKRPPDNVDAKGNLVELPVDPERTKGQPRVFSGPIASANTLLKDAKYRDELGRAFGVKAVEMEGSGIADATWNNERSGYLVVRGIVDYCDDGKGDRWHWAAALAAASYTRALVGSLHVKEKPANPT